jgi:hypothetical protein
MRGMTNDPLRDLMLHNVFEGLADHARISRNLIDRWEKAFKELEIRKELDNDTIQLLESISEYVSSDELRRKVQTHTALLKSLQGA